MIEVYKAIQRDTDWLTDMQKISDYSMRPGATGPFQGDHGERHAKMVSSYAVEILDQLGEDKNTIIAGAISGLLHDRALVSGERSLHAERSAVKARQYLARFAMAKSDIERIVHAIANHSDGQNSNSNLDLALLLADKADINRDRLRQTNDSLARGIQHLRRISVQINLAEKHLNLSYNTDQAFDPTTIYEWPKMITIPQLVADQLDLSLRFYINEKPVNLTETLPKLYKNT
jgi:HD superfamily phosphohydrolase YqeK